ncbi:MAG TPA: hypothetical protein VKB88_36355 [Bryobacteraceae bacterium]|nr:hypothetical protein [Bryobacteraceae bacterium]
MRKPTRITLQLAASLGLAAAARAQQPADPCQAPGFNETACREAINRHGYCAQGSWVASRYHEKYPYYYDVYQAYAAQGGTVTPAVPGDCHRPWRGGTPGAARGGFGLLGAGGHAHS